MKEVLLESAAFSNHTHKGFDRKPLLKEHESVMWAFFFFQAALKESVRSFPSFTYMNKQSFQWLCNVQLFKEVFVL